MSGMQQWTKDAMEDLCIPLTGYHPSITPGIQIGPPCGRCQCRTYFVDEGPQCTSCSVAEERRQVMLERLVVAVDGVFRLDLRGLPEERRAETHRVLWNQLAQLFVQAQAVKP